MSVIGRARQEPETQVLRAAGVGTSKADHTVPAGVAPAGALVPTQRQRQGQARLSPPAVRTLGLPRGGSVKPVLRVVVVAAATVAAVAGGLNRLWPAVVDQGYGSHLAAVPLVLALVLVFRARPSRTEPDIHDRQIDYLVGLCLLGVAGFVVTALPVRFGDQFWTMHADLAVAAPLLAGAIALVFGTRALWRLRFVLAAFAAALIPLPHGAAEQIASPFVSVVEAAASHAASWSVPTAGAPSGAGTPSSAGILLLADGGGETASNVHHVMDVGATLAGPAGVLAALVVAVVVVAASPGPLAALRWGLGVLGLWLVASVVRVASALGLGSTYGAGPARWVFGVGGDLVALGVVVIALVLALGRQAGRRREAERAEPRRRKPPVQRARGGLVLVLAASAALCLLGTVLAPDLG